MQLNQRHQALIFQIIPSLNLRQAMRIVIIVATSLIAGASCDDAELRGNSASDIQQQNNIVAIETLSPGADELNAVNAQGWTPLMHASAIGDSKKVQQLLSKNADPNIAGDGQQTPLMLSSRAPDTQVTQMLIASGANLNAVDVRGMAALMVAVSTGRVDSALLLLKSGADVTIQDLEGRTAISMAAEYGSPSDLFQAILDKGSDINQRIGKKQSTLLMLAANSGNVNAIRILVNAGVKVDERDAIGETAAFYAVHLNKYAALNVLIESGADPKVTRNDGSPLVALAASKGREECLTVLKDSGVPIPSPNPAVHVGN